MSEGGLNWFRCNTGTIGRSELELFSGRTIDVPSCFISGKADWGIYRKPGAIDRMRTQACTRMDAVELVDGAGHWVQQEKAEQLTELLIAFLARANTGPPSP
jgi:pimeloyl-ACP methyl ester carboxylesterase